MRHGRQYVNVKEAAHMFGLPVGSVMAAVKRGELGIVHGTRGLLSVRDVGRYVSVLGCALSARASAQRTRGCARR